MPALPRPINCFNLPNTRWTQTNTPEPLRTSTEYSHHTARKTGNLKPVDIRMVSASILAFGLEEASARIAVSASITNLASPGFMLLGQGMIGNQDCTVSEVLETSSGSRAVMALNEAIDIAKNTMVIPHTLVLITHRLGTCSHYRHENSIQFLACMSIGARCFEFAPRWKHAAWCDSVTASSGK